MHQQRTIAWAFIISLILLVSDCKGTTRVTTRNWGPQSMMYLKGKHGRRDALEKDGGLYSTDLVSWMNYINNLISYQKTKETLEQLSEKIDI
ncbi:spexin prohormone 2-like [Discoglossus pictus]